MNPAGLKRGMRFALLLLSMALLSVGASTSCNRLADSTNSDSLDPPSSPPTSVAEPRTRASSSRSDKPASQSGSAPSQPTVSFARHAAPATKEELEAEAIFTAEQLLATMPEVPRAMHVSALLYAQLHQTAKAEELWARCLELDPQAEPYYVNLAAIAMDRGKSELAVATLEKALENGIDSPNISHHLSLALMNIGELEKAVEVATAAVEQYESAAHLLVLGQAQLKVGHTQAAEASLRKAIALGAQTKTAYFALFNACMRNGKVDEARKFREKYDSFDDDDEKLAADERYQVLSDSEARRVALSVLAESAALYMDASKPREAEHIWLRILALDPSHTAALRELAELYESQEREGDAVVAHQRLTEADPNNLLNYLLLARSQIANEDPQAAEASIKLAISLAPQQVTGYAAMTDFLLEQQQPERAQWYIEYALKIKPSSQGYQLLAKTLRAQGKEPEAREAEKLANRKTEP